MTATPNKQYGGKILDKAGRLDFVSKTIRGKGGARIYTQTPQFFTHFLDVTVANLAFTTSKTDNSGASGAVLVKVADAIGGTAIMTCSDAASPCGNTAIVPGGLAWQASLATNKSLVFEARLKFSSNTQAGTYFFGFTDNSSAESNDTCYRISSSSTLTTSAPTDAAGFAFSSAPSSGALYNSTADLLGAITTKADTDTVSAFSTSYINDGTIFDGTAFHIYRVELDSSGNALFLIDDKPVKTVASALTAATPLAGVFNVVGASAAKSLTVDYVLVGGQTFANVNN